MMDKLLKKHFFYNLLVTSFFTIICSSLFSKTLSGVVFDSLTKEPIFGANVYFPELEKGVSTDINGKFTITGLPSVKLRLKISYIGYRTIMLNIDLTKESIKKLTILLNETVIEAHDIVVSVAYATTQDESAVKVDEMSRKELNNGGGTNLMQNLTSIPGIEQVSTGAGIGKPVIRGLSYNRVLVFSQGIRLENQQWGDEHGLGLSDMGVQRIEIIKGPSSLLFGSDAMGGVIHLIDEDPAPTGKTIGDWNTKYFSNTNGISTNIGLKHSGEKFRWNVRGGYLNHDDYKTGGDNAVHNTRNNAYGAKIMVGWNNEHFSSRLNYNIYHSQVGLYELDTTSTKSNRIPTLPYQDLLTHIASWQNTIFIKKSKIKTTFGLIANNRIEYGGAFDTINSIITKVAGLKMQLLTGTYDVSWYLPKIKRMQYIIATQGMLQSNNNSGTELLIPNAYVKDVGIALLAKYNFEPLHIQGGLRIDNRNINVHDNLLITPSDTIHTNSLLKNYNSINGAIGATYHLGKLVLFRGNIASGFRAPNLAELTSDGVHEGTFRYEKGNTTLTSEQNIEYDLSMHFHSEHMTIDVAGFYNFIYNYIYLSPSDSFANSYRIYDYLQGNAFLYGGEAELDLHPHPIHFIHITSKYAMVIGELQSGGYLPLIPAISWTNGLTIELKKIENIKFLHESFINVNLKTVFQQNNTSHLESSTNGYHLLNAGLGTEIKAGTRKIELSVTGNNLLDLKYFNHLSRLKEENIYEMGRNIAINIHIPLL